MTQIINSPFFIAFFMGAIAIATSVWGRKNTKLDDVYKKLDSKLDKDDHQAFSKRIGKQVDGNETEIGKIGKAVAWLVGKNAGDYEKIIGG